MIAEMTPEQYARVRAHFDQAIDNIVQHCKRSLLDTVASVLPPGDSPVAGMLRKRIHNDVTIIYSQVMASFQIVESGGVVPPFGQRDPDAKAHASGEAKARLSA